MSSPDARLAPLVPRLQPAPAAHAVDAERVFRDLAIEVICFIQHGRWYNGKVDDKLAAEVAARLQWGPGTAWWPADRALFKQWQAARRTMLPRVPVAPELPRVAVVPELPRAPVVPQLPRVLPIPTLPRVTP